MNPERRVVSVMLHAGVTSEPRGLNRVLTQQTLVGSQQTARDTRIITNGAFRGRCMWYLAYLLHHQGHSAFLHPL